MGECAGPYFDFFDDIGALVVLQEKKIQSIMRLGVISGIVLLLLGGSLWWYSSSSEKGKIRKELIFNVEDTGAIRQISLLDREGNRIRLEKKQRKWYVNGETPARRDAVDNLLKTIHDQRVSSLIPSAAKDNVVKDLSSQSIRVDLKGGNDRRLLTFYVGGVTPDERGTFMIREDSEWPVIVGVPGFEGALRSRYVMPELDWYSRKLLPGTGDFKEISVDYPGQQEHSMKILREGKDCLVRPLHRTDTAAVAVNRYVCEAYGDLLDALYAEAVLDPGKIVRLEGAVPFCRITITSTDHSVQELVFYPTDWVDERAGEGRPSTIDRYYTLYNGRQLFLTQETLMQKAFVGYDHFMKANRDVSR